MRHLVIAATLALLTQSAAAGTGYEGNYELDQDFKVTVTADHGTLYMQAAQHPCYRMEVAARKAHCAIAPGRLLPMQWAVLKPTAGKDFVLDGTNATFHFEDDALDIIQSPDRIVFPHPRGPSLHLRRIATEPARTFQPAGARQTSAQLKEYAGVYSEDGKFDLQVALEHGHLGVQPMDGPHLLMFEDGPDRFIMRFPPMAAQFERGPSGRIEQVRWFMEGQDHVLTRQAEGYASKVPASPAGKTCKTSPGPAPLVDRGRFLADRLNSRYLGETLPVCLYLPPGYDDSDRRYPVIYATDGEYIESLATLLERKHVPAIIVGLGGFDLREVNLILPGAENYFRFAAREVVPYVEARYRIDASQRILYGHSHGGTFAATAALLDDPVRPLFAHVLSSDGSLWTQPIEFGALLDKRKRAGARLPVHLIMAGAGHGNGDNVRMNYAHLRDAGFEALRLELLDLPNENHGTIALIAWERTLASMLPHDAPPLGGVALRADSQVQALAYGGAGTYFGNIRLARGEHRLLLDSARGQFGGAALQADGHAIATNLSRQALRIDVPRDGVYGVRVVAGAQPMLALAPALSRFEAEPFYLRGSVNNWGTANAFRRIDALHYRAELDLNAGTHELKVGSADFQSIDFGAAPADPKLDAAPVVLQAGGANLVLSLDAPARLQFDLDVADADAPRLTATRRPR
ncbi:MAG TPA: alpha/beta hydrolase-fold protein [Telluria sp.]|nr:alpha/beta hydrolase-fold protein [Telluria sp.]